MSREVLSKLEPEGGIVIGKAKEKNMPGSMYKSLLLKENLVDSRN